MGLSSLLINNKDNIVLLIHINIGVIMPQTKKKPEPSETKKHYQLPDATSFHEVNQNFDTLSGMVVTIVHAMEQHAETTNQNLTRLATETSDNLAKLAADLKSVLSSQTMMLTICIIVICFVALLFKGVADLVNSFI